MDPPTSLIDAVNDATSFLASVLYTGKKGVRSIYVYLWSKKLFMDNNECITQDITCGSVCHMIRKTVSSTIEMQKRTQFIVQIKRSICIWRYQSTVPKKRQCTAIFIQT